MVKAGASINSTMQLYGFAVQIARASRFLRGLWVRLDLLIFDYEEARKPGEAEAPTEDTEKCLRRNTPPLAERLIFLMGIRYLAPNELKET